MGFSLQGSVRRTAIGSRLWSIYATTWDEAGHPRDWTELLIELLDRPEGSGQLLDVGCGTGSHSLVLAESGFEVVGIDAAHGMLRRAGEKATAQTKVRFQQADFNQPLAFSYASFDCAICVSSLQCARDPLFLLRELGRVLRPDGRLVVLSSTGNSPFPPTAPVSWRYRHLHAAKRIADQLGLVPRFTAQQLSQLVTNAGYVVTMTREQDGAVGLAASPCQPPWAVRVVDN